LNLCSSSRKPVLEYELPFISTYNQGNAIWIVLMIICAVKSMLFRGLFMTSILLVNVTAFPSGLNPVLHAGNLSAKPRLCDLQSDSFNPAVLRHLEKISLAHGSTDSLQKDGAVSIEADKIRSNGQGIWLMDGHVHVRNEHNGVFADQAEFNEITRIARFFGNVLLYGKDGHPLSAKNLQIDMDLFKGEMTDNATIHIVERTLPILKQDHSISALNGSLLSGNQENPLPHLLSDNNYRFLAKATAEKIEINGENYHIVHNATMTACPGEDPDVELTAREVELDHEQGQGRAENLVVRFKNVPIFYFPKVYFPITGERMSGFLFPRVGYLRRSGLILSFPYYLNLHPQYDATVAPSIIGKRGFQIYGETRYLTVNSRGMFKGEVLPDDDIYKDDRYALSIRHRQSLSDKAKLDVDMEKVSDTEYRSDFADNVDSRSSVFSRQRISFAYNNQYMRVNARVMGHEAVSSHFKEEEQPYDLLPELRLQLRNIGISGFSFGARTELTHYRHDSNKINGSRLRFIPHLSAPIRRVYGYIEPKVALHSIRYDIKDKNNEGHRIDESIPVWSIDSGLYFERKINLGGKDHLQTLEPRLFYLDIPARHRQDEFPNFDTGPGNANSLSHYFRENRFFGGDRVGDTRQITAALTSRFTDQSSGREIGKISFGQVHYFEDREIGENVNSPLEKRDSSDLLFEFESTLNHQWMLGGFASWSGEQDEFSHVSLLSRYEINSETSNEAGYIQDSGQREYIKLDHNSKFASNWLYRVRTHYSIPDDQFQFAEISNTYLNCCWSFGINVQRYQNDGKRDNRVMISFSLKGLGGN